VNQGYKKQVQLLLDVLPEVAKEDCFAMHGGTAINLFVRNLPRLSVDIDLTYVHIAERKESLEEMNKALLRIKQRIENSQQSIKIEHKAEICKLMISRQGIVIKIETNMVGRGLIGGSSKVQLCETAQEEFDAFCVMPIVPIEQLYGGKICAALDRQHPRDLFDVKLLLDNEGLTDQIKRGLIFFLLCSARPIHELIEPNLINQRIAFNQQFEGMSAINFSYDDFEATRNTLIKKIIESLNDKDKTFLLNFNSLEVDWAEYNFQDLPSVQWKLINLEKLKKGNPAKYDLQSIKLRKVLGV
jgi:predicted nucleotidyltransferase component of viral defense system